MIQRQCKLPKNNSFFLFGPRGSGKTTRLEDVFDKSEALFIDLLDPEIYDDFLLDILNRIRISVFLMYDRMFRIYSGTLVEPDTNTQHKNTSKAVRPYKSRNKAF